MKLLTVITPMRAFFALLWIALHLQSCSSASKGSGDSLIDVVALFPTSEITNLVEGMTQEELKEILEKGQSENWIMRFNDEAKGELVITNKHASDNFVDFVLYKGSYQDILGVRQANAQNVVHDFWAFNKNPDGDHPEQWIRYFLPQYGLTDFIDERITLYGDAPSTDITPFLSIRMTPQAVYYELNPWLYMRDLEANNIVPDGPLDPRFHKYIIAHNWDGTLFDVTKTVNPGYDTTIVFTTYLVEENPDGPGPTEFDCPIGVEVSASSSLQAQGDNAYKVENILDERNDTAWSEGKDDDGIGEWIEFKVTESYRIGGTYQLLNGYTKNKTAWESNGRVKKFKVLIDDQFVGYVLLANVDQYQSFNVVPPWLNTGPELKLGMRIRFVIEEVYKGTKFTDTLITSFVPTGNCG